MTPWIACIARSVSWRMTLHVRTWSPKKPENSQRPQTRTSPHVRRRRRRQHAPMQANADGVGGSTRCFSQGIMSHAPPVNGSRVLALLPSGARPGQGSLGPVAHRRQALRGRRGRRALLARRAQELVRVLIRLGHSKAQLAQAGAVRVFHLRVAPQREENDRETVPLKVVDGMCGVAVEQRETVAQVERILLVRAFQKLPRLAFPIVIWIVVQLTPGEIAERGDHRGTEIVSVSMDVGRVVLVDIQ